jgi:hypothetical protein
MQVARFSWSDRPELVEAALVCQWCLRSTVAVTVVEGIGDAVAVCVCAHCPDPTEVLLDDQQVLRLRFSPLARQSVRVVSS